MIGIGDDGNPDFIDTLELYEKQLKGPTKPYHRLTQKVNAQFSARMV